MSKFSENTKEYEKKEKKENNRKDKLASYFYDLSKLSFGGVAIGSGISWVNDIKRFELMLILLFGVYLTFAFAYLANKTLKQ